MLADVAPIRERLESLGALVTAVLPSGGSTMPVSGRYYPAAGGHGPRKPLCQVKPDDFDLLVLPGQLTADGLMKLAETMKLLQENFFADAEDPVPVMLPDYLEQLLDSGVDLSGLSRPRPPDLAGKDARVALASRQPGGMKGT
ncbi:MAG: type 1 glutamine amidotransferase family protein [Armatimonadota bacterium]